MSERNFRVNSPKHNRIHSSNNPPPKKDSEKEPSGPLRDKIANVRKNSEQEWKDFLEYIITQQFEYIEKRILHAAKDLTCSSIQLDKKHKNVIDYGDYLFDGYLRDSISTVNGVDITVHMMINGLCGKLKDSGLKVSCKYNEGPNGTMLSEMKISWD